MAHTPLLPETPYQSPPFRRLALLHHPRVPATQTLIQQLEDVLRERWHIACCASVWDSELLQTMLPEVDCCIVLGGDGSMLRTARVAGPYGVPILGINMGKLGFLAELEPAAAAVRLPEILSGNYWIEERMMINAELIREGQIVTSQECLNEVVVAKRHLSRVIRVNTSIDGYTITNYTADGVLVATPTGSTAYSLAAGGPILHPEVRSMVLIPISAHLSLRSPLVLPNTTEVRLTVNTDHEAGASFDGQSDIEMQSGDTMVVRAGANVARFVRAQERSYFYHTLVHKLGINH